MFRFCRDLLRASVLVAQVESARRTLGLARSIADARNRGRKERRRSESERALLQRAISTVDRLVPGPPNCYRRVLLEVALDSGAAEQTVMLGFRSGGGPRSGHAWLAGTKTPQTSYDAVFSV